MTDQKIVTSQNILDQHYEEVEELQRENARLRDAIRWYETALQYRVGTAHYEVAVMSARKMLTENTMGELEGAGKVND